MRNFHQFAIRFRVSRKKLLCLCIICMLAAASSLIFLRYKAKENLKRTHDIRAKIAQIPEDEKSDLKFFLRKLMFRSTFAYTLFGDKPMSFEDLIKEECVWKHYMRSFTSIDYGLDLFRYQRGWKVWKKYERLFPLKKFIFVQQEYPDSKQIPAQLGHVSVTLVHKDNFFAILKQYSQDFKKVIGKDFNPHELLNNAFRGKCLMSLAKRIKKHAALLGILLGYGRENAWYYYELDKLRSKMRKDPSCQEEFEAAQKQFKPFSNYNSDLQYPIWSPMFMCLPESKETKELRQKYLRQYKKICEIYRNGDFLEITLLKLTEE